MLRATSNSLTKASAWKNTAIYSSVRNYATPSATPAPASDNKEKPSLSQRLGGTGRGKIMEGSSDPFASFLANAKKPRNNNNNNRNGTFTPRNRKPQQSEDQFADAPEQPKQQQQQRPRNENNRNNNSKNRNNRQNRQNEKQNVEGAPAADQSNTTTTNNNKRNNKNNRNNAQNGGKKMNLRRSQQPQEIRTRRATTFIDKDIDWASFETTTLSVEAPETQVAATEKDSDELVLKDAQGDYGRYISTGSDLTWPPMIQGETLSTLVGSNPTFDLQQKTAFMAAVTKAINVAKDKQKYKLVAFPEPPPVSPEQLADATRLFARPVNFIQSISKAEQAPETSKPEVAFVGRSNVGKSTLINNLTNNSRLVKTSNRPGHTRLLNFFDVGRQITLVDMPGYGFKSKEEWGDLILEYLSTRKQLKRLFMLIDPVAGLKETDMQLMSHLDKQALSYQVILTKRDRLSKEAFAASKAEIEKYLVENAICCYPQLLVTGKQRSSKFNDNEVVANEMAKVKWAIVNATGITVHPPTKKTIK
ncbi:hypothetical protein MUCCIDRAFT_115129 [Mucor lusitanicus CBS 277.49]|uniref:GTP-binding protein 8 n=1 Tax=Mucor lusitanicus CBS 277.49 TaxID=747725 RepID=A0A168HK52_MUCCL|nr:hypothetical protein MUCCIDRAFT_115129 [Mucor lusitanicus CBS 277.49]